MLHGLDIQTLKTGNVEYFFTQVSGTQCWFAVSQLLLPL